MGEKKTQKGFTIVELLIVIVVIAILAAISLIMYTNIQNKAAGTALQSDLKNATTQLGMTQAENGNYPAGPTPPSELRKTNGTTYQYDSDGINYCLTATSSRSGVPAYYVTNTSGVREGACPGHTNTGGGEDIATNAPIQSVTQAQCQALPVFTGSNEDAIRNVSDGRGGVTRVYRIAKLADNKCWMLDNLKLGSTSGAIVLTPSDSNVAGNFTLPQVIAGGGTDLDSSRVYGPVPGDSGSGASNYGYLYNWPAVTAGESRTTMPIGSGNASYSICASGWRLPTGDASGDFALLNAKMNNPGASSPSTSSGSGYYQNWHYSGQFRGVLSGYWSGSAFGHQNSSGYFWSRTAYSSHAGNAFHSFYNATSTSPGHSGSRALGQAVRCILN